MKYAIVGASGQLGMEFSKLTQGSDMHLFTRNEMDVSDPVSVNNCLDRVDCSVVINVAAFHNVNESEQDSLEAFQVNSIGAGNIARAAAKKGCKVVFFSSDYVFGMDATRHMPYTENDLVGPLNVYGVSKVAGEQFVRIANADHIIVRTSSLFGARTSKKGWTFPEMIIARARRGEALKVVDDQIMSPTYCSDLVQTVARLIAADIRGTVHVTNEGACSWHEFAVAALEFAGIDRPVEAVRSNTFPSIAKRPAYSVLKCGREDLFERTKLRHWKTALAEWVEAKQLADEYS